MKEIPKNEEVLDLPKKAQLEAELKRIDYNIRFRKILKSTIYTLVVVAAFSVLLSMLVFPVFKIYGTSMSPTVKENQIVVALKGSSFESGDVVVLYYNNKVLVKRVIAGPGQWVDIDADGNVFVDNVQLNEPYLQEKAYGYCNIALPYQVPDERFFVMGDNRATSADSRSSSIGCIANEQILGRAILRIWPLSEISTINVVY